MLDRMLDDGGEDSERSLHLSGKLCDPGRFVQFIRWRLYMILLMGDRGVLPWMETENAKVVYLICLKRADGRRRTTTGDNMGRRRNIHRVNSHLADGPEGGRQLLRPN